MTEVSYWTQRTRSSASPFNDKYFKCLSTVAVYTSFYKIRLVIDQTSLVYELLCVKSCREGNVINQ